MTILNNKLYSDKGTRLHFQPKKLIKLIIIIASAILLTKQPTVITYDITEKANMLNLQLEHLVLTYIIIKTYLTK